MVRLVGAILLEQSDEWATQRSRYLTPETIGAVSITTPVSLSAAPASRGGPNPPEIISLHDATGHDQPACS